MRAERLLGLSAVVVVALHWIGAFLPGPNSWGFHHWAFLPRPLLAAADVFLLTSKWEGLPRTLIEAMAMGKAPVVTQVDGVLDVIEDNVTGYVRDPGDLDELTAMVVRLFRAPNLIKEMGVQNPKFIRKPEFSVERMVTRIGDVYDRLLAAPR